MNPKDFWDNWYEAVDDTDWEDKPSIFAQFALSYIPKEGKILELGAGLGKDSRYFASLGYGVTYTDFSDTAIRIAQFEAQNQKLQMEFMNMDISKIFPFDDQKFDIVYSHAVLHYFNHRVTDQIFREIHRCLKDNGVFATLLKSVEDPEILKSQKLDNLFYKTPQGLTERFFSTNELEIEIAGLFKPIVMDASEQTHESENATFIRFIGSKIPLGKQSHTHSEV